MSSATDQLAADRLLPIADAATMPQPNNAAEASPRERWIRRMKAPTLPPFSGKDGETYGKSTSQSISKNLKSIHRCYYLTTLFAYASYFALYKILTRIITVFLFDRDRNEIGTRIYGGFRDSGRIKCRSFMLTFCDCRLTAVRKQERHAARSQRS